MHSDNSLNSRTTRFIEAIASDEAHVVQSQLSGKRVAIVMEPTIGDSFVGQVIAFTLLNLLVRLNDYCPALEIALPSVSRHSLVRLLPAGPLQSSLQEFFTPFPAARRLIFRNSATSELFHPADLRIAISPKPLPGALSVWADGWIVYLNEVAPPGPWDHNSVGASVAAGFAAAEVFKHLIVDVPLKPGLRVVRTERLIFSAYDYGLSAGENPPLPPTIDVNGVVLVGLGGIGAAFVAAASCLPSLSGILTLVDKDTLDSTNLNRHLVARPGDRGFKVDLCRQALAFHPLVEARQEWFDEFLEAKGNRHDLVVVGVDKDRVRRAVQASQPRLILNAGTSDLASFRVTRHEYLYGACLACISRDDLQDHPVERELARKLGLDLSTILKYQATGELIPKKLLVERGVLDEASIQQLGDRSLLEIQERVCAQVLLGTDQQEEAVSISFLSALPGFLLLGELIKERAHFDRQPPPLNDQVNHLLLSVFGRPHLALLRGWRDKRQDCDCNRGAYQRAYRRKWLKA